jgi:PAS domain S-box-containing protein
VTRLAGISFEEYIGATNEGLGLPKEMVTLWNAEILKVFERGEQNKFEFHHTTADGPRYLQARLVPEFGPDGSVATVLNIVRDLTERYEVETLLRKSEEKFKRIFVDSPLAILTYDRHGLLTDANPAALQTVGAIAVEDLVGLRLFDNPQLTPARLAQLDKQEIVSFQSILDFDNIRRLGFYSPTKSGLIHIDWVITRYPYGYLVQIQDITDRKEAMAQIRKALEEKEVLLRELYHRTKNNMAVISALLEMQSSYLKDDQLQAAFRETQNRIQTMALVHQKLYQSQDLSHLDLSDYIRELGQLLMTSYEVLPDRITLVLNTRPVSVLIDTAIACGLILNELISNALKHAFPGDVPGEITIELNRPAADEILVQVADNGVGVPEDFDFRKSDTLGLLTVFAIGEHQLQGQVTFENDGGVSCQLRFKDNLYQPRI